tara:strand:+ start:469 stop:1038 length:570 start_codon:yes stop_codon:yes gene_type:complete
MSESYLNCEMLENVPSRSPRKVLDILYPYFKDKVVCELGCKVGDILLGFSYYAKECLGYDIEPHYIKVAKTRPYKCPSYILHENCMTADTLDRMKKYEPECFFSYSHGDWYLPWFETIHNNFPNAIIVTSADPREGLDGDPPNNTERKYLEDLQNRYPGNYVEFEYEEEGQRAKTFLLHIFVPEGIEND